ncbi:MAG TPA: patatin-like phospholipase family protein [Petrotogaceae bacterium]|nr:patatin-like phospholipase family protein [Petrotogaceae bacterium]HQC41468.1 patatin-like phospholipase family protein [Petrotogaceae bacterium]
MKKIITVLIMLIFSALSVFSYGLSICGGGAYAFKCIGFLQALSEEGFCPDEVASTSLGSIAGYFMACGYDMSHVHKLFSKINFTDLFDISLPLNGGFLNSARLGDFIAFSSGCDSYLDMQSALKMAALNMNTLNVEFLDKGDPIKALRASTAMQGHFEPVVINSDFFADAGVKELSIINPQEIFCSDENFLIRLTPSYRDTSDIDFRNIINVIFAAIEAGGINRDLYAADKLSYNEIFDIESSIPIDVKFFSKGLVFYNDGYLAGKKFLNENPDFFERNNIPQKNIQKKTLDIESICTSLRTESYLRPREFYWTVKADIHQENSDKFVRSYIYSEFLNSRIRAGIAYKFNDTLYPYISLQTYYFPLRCLRFTAEYVHNMRYGITLRTYLMEKYKSIVYADLSYTHGIKDDNLFTFGLTFDGMYSYNSANLGPELSLKILSDLNIINGMLSIKNIYGDDYMNLSVSSSYNYKNNFNQIPDILCKYPFIHKISQQYALKIPLIKNLDIDMFQTFLLQDIYGKFYFNWAIDDFILSSFLPSCGLSLFFPFRFAGVSNSFIECGINYRDNFSFFFSLSDYLF